MKEKNQVLYDEFYVLYNEIYEVAIQDDSGEQDNDDVFIIGCSEIDDHVKKMLENSNEYCRNIDLAIISTFLNIDIHIYTNLNGIPRKK